MSTKTMVMMGMTFGTFIGSYLPVLFGAGTFSLWSIVGGAVGGFLGIWAGWKLANF